MTIEIWYVGNTQPGPYMDLERDFVSRLNYFYKTEIKVFKHTRSTKDPIKQLQLEEDWFLQQLSKKKKCVVLLDENGLQFKSRPFASWFNQNILTQSLNPCFIIGGAFGFTENMKKNADYKIALSNFTLSHMLARVVLLEQLYRACTLLHNHPYHND